MRPATLAIIGTALGAAAGHAFRAPFPGMGGNPVLDLIAYHDPGLHTVIRVWYYAAPAVAVVLAGSVCLSVWRVWLEPRAGGGRRGTLPPWPASPEDDAPSLVVGELHHPVVPRESERPSWLVVPETGLYTGVLIVGAVGSGKTTACMYPFAQQLLSWQADRAGRRASALVLEPHEAPGLTAAWLHRAAIHIARPLGLDPAARPILDARLEDGSRVAICTPPASPEVAITIRRFGGRAFSAQDLVRMGSLPETVLGAARSALLARRNILVSGGTGSGKTTLNALIELLPEDERIVAIEDTLELRIERANCLRFEAGAVGTETSVSIRDLVRHALRHRPDHIVVGEVRGGEAADLLQALNTGHGGSLTTIHANNARSALSRLASCAMQAEGALPWEVTCRGVVDGIALVLHTTRQRGRRFVEEALEVRGYDAVKGRWIAEPIWSGADEAPQEQHPHTKEVNP